MNFGLRYLAVLFAWILAAILTGLLVSPWLFAAIGAIGVVLVLNTRCNVCWHNAGASKRGIGRIPTATCANCGASLEDVYPFSYFFHPKRPTP